MTKVMCWIGIFVLGCIFFKSFDAGIIVILTAISIKLYSQLKAYKK